MAGIFFPWPTVCFVECLDRNYVSFCETKNCRRYYLSAVFFPVFQGGKIFPPGAQKNKENFRHVERNQKNTFTPYKCATFVSFSSFGMNPNTELYMFDN
jgi:hypothetical protein